MSLAAERTYLAYRAHRARSSRRRIAVVGALPDAGHEGLRRLIGVLLVLAAVLALLLVLVLRVSWLRV